MKDKKPHSGGSGDSTGREYGNEQLKSSQTFEGKLRCFIDWLYDNRISGNNRRGILLGLGTILLDYCHQRECRHVS